MFTGDKRDPEATREAIFRRFREKLTGIMRDAQNVLDELEIIRARARRWHCPKCGQEVEFTQPIPLTKPHPRCEHQSCACLLEPYPDHPSNPNIYR